VAPACELAADLPRLRHLCDLLELEFSRLAAAFASTDEYRQDGSVSPTSWIRHRCAMSANSAADRIRVGRMLPQLPDSEGATSAGDVGFAHLSLIASTARALAESPSTAGCREDQLIEAAREQSVSRFRHFCTELRRTHEPVEHPTEAGELRHLHVSTRPDHQVQFTGRLDAVGGAILCAALEPLAQPTGPDDTRPHCRRLGDALVELASRGDVTGWRPSLAGSPSPPARTAPAPHPRPGRPRGGRPRAA
jgi:hypothetical protein